MVLREEGVRVLVDSGSGTALRHFLPSREDDEPNVGQHPFIRPEQLARLPGTVRSPKLLDLRDQLCVVGHHAPLEHDTIEVSASVQSLASEPSWATVRRMFEAEPPPHRPPPVLRNDRCDQSDDVGNR